MTTATGSSFRPLAAGQRIAAVIDYAVGSHARAAAVLILCSLVLFLPGFFQIPPVDRDEARFAQASKQMVESGDYVDIRFQAEVRYKKPVGIYWLQAGVVHSARALGMVDAPSTIWLYRVPSLIGAIGAVLLSYWAALSFVARRGALLAALMMAGSVLLGVEARLAKTDAVLLLTVLAAMGALARAYMRHEPHRLAGDLGLMVPAIFWTALAAGVLIKGPLILLFVGLTMLTLAVADRSLQWARALRPAAGTVWFLLLVLPWFLAIVFRSGGGFFAGSLGEDMMMKVAGGQESHGAPPGLYLLLFWFTFWPGALLAGIALPAVWNTRREKGTRFLLAWPFAAAAVVFGLLAWRSYPSEGAERALLRALVASALIAVTVYAVTLPALTRLFPSVQLADAVKNADCRHPAVASAGFQEPSLVFLAGTSTLLTSGTGAADFLAQGGCRFAFVDSVAEPSFRQRAQAIRLRYAVGPRVEGFNYAAGRMVSIAVFRTEAQP